MLLNSEPISEDFGYLVLRLGFGGTMVWQHGWPKLMAFGEKMDSFADPFGMGPMFSLVLIGFGNPRDVDTRGQHPADHRDDRRRVHGPWR